MVTLTWLEQVVLFLLLYFTTIIIIILSRAMTRSAGRWIACNVQMAATPTHQWAYLKWLPAALCLDQGRTP